MAQPMTTDALLAGAPPFDAALVRTIRMIGRSKGVPRADWDDLVQCVWLEVDRGWARIAPLPEKQRRKYVLGIARNVARDWFKAEKDVELVPMEALRDERSPHDDGAIERSDQARALCAKATERDAQGTGWMVRHVVNEESLKEIADADRVAYTTVRKRVERVIAWLRENSGVLSLFVLLTLCGLRWYFMPRPHTATPPQDQQQRTPKQRARELRRKALLECELQRWDPCLAGLDEARRDDPDGDAALEVQQARAQAESALATPSAQSPSPVIEAPGYERKVPSDDKPPQRSAQPEGKPR